MFVEIPVFDISYIQLVNQKIKRGIVGRDERDYATIDSTFFLSLVRAQGVACLVAGDERNLPQKKA